MVLSSIAFFFFSNSSAQSSFSYMYFWQTTFFVLAISFSTFTYATASFIGPSKASFSFSTIFTRFNFSLRSSFNCSTSETIFSKGSCK
ncbi:hypothetical protein L798_04084 [Zootermopsis nevadensis]|uniref:Uncharacterized protein n=1 Tax=Zootermopsis nevadensis TaxID=136037 RepID=A0A067RKQ8_ZOONE|nr:hypothetical protein L798_04084 [Zootermopsis nevadensis]